MRLRANHAVHTVAAMHAVLARHAIEAMYALHGVSTRRLRADRAERRATPMRARVRRRHDVHGRACVLARQGVSMRSDASCVGTTT